jgi:hypothetical protein
MWVVVMAGVLFLPGCKKSDDTTLSEICYTWEWVRSVGGIGGTEQTPDSEGYTQKIKFDEDDRYTKYRNDLVVGSGTYTITSAESILDGQVYDMVVFDDGSPNQAIISVTGSELILREDCFDCFTHTYQK